MTAYDLVIQARWLRWMKVIISHITMQVPTVAVQKKILGQRKPFQIFARFNLSSISLETLSLCRIDWLHWISPVVSDRRVGADLDIGAVNNFSGLLTSSTGRPWLNLTHNATSTTVSSALLFWAQTSVSPAAWSTSSTTSWPLRIFL